MTTPRDELGQAGERAAERFLKNLRYKILARRFNTPVGEIDLICRDGDTIVFVEVKTQQSAELLDPESRVTRTKQSRLAKAAAWYVNQKKLHDKPLRFDVVAVVMADTKSTPEVEHFIDAFVPDDWAF